MCEGVGFERPCNQRRRPALFWEKMLECVDTVTDEWMGIEKEQIVYIVAIFSALRAASLLMKSLISTSTINIMFSTPVVEDAAKLLCSSRKTSMAERHVRFLAWGNQPQPQPQSQATRICRYIWRARAVLRTSLLCKKQHDCAPLSAP